MKKWGCCRQQFGNATNSYDSATGLCSRTSGSDTLLLPLQKISGCFIFRWKTFTFPYDKLIPERKETWHILNYLNISHNWGYIFKFNRLYIFFLLKILTRVFCILFIWKKWALDFIYYSLVIFICFSVTFKLIYLFLAYSKILMLEYMYLFNN